VTDCDLEKSFNFEKTVKITRHVRMCKHIVVNNVIFSQGIVIITISNSKAATFKVIQGHWYWCHWI